MRGLITQLEEKEQDWSSFKNESNLQDVSWKFDDERAKFARDGFKKHKFSGRRLKLFVKHSIEAERLNEKQEQELRQLEEIEKFDRLIKNI